MKTIQRRKKGERLTSKDGGCEPQEQSDSERVDSRDAERFAGFGEPAGREATCEGLNIRV